jgi:hypothetical protein
MMNYMQCEDINENCWEIKHAWRRI